MDFRVNKSTINKNQIGIPAMNYGQMWRYKNYKNVVYEIQIDTEEFYTKITDWFIAFRLDAIEDSGLDEKGEFVMYDKYEGLNFPELKDLIQRDKTLLEEIVKFHDIDILNILCNHKVSKEGNVYSINSLDEINIDESVLIKGIAFLMNENTF